MAPAVHLQPMPAQREVMCCRHLLELGFNVTAQQVLRSSASDAKQVMVVAVVAQLIMQVAVLKEDPTNGTRINQQLEAAINGGPPNPWQLLPQLFRGEMVFLPGDGVGYRPARQRRTVAPLFQGTKQLLSQGVSSFAHSK